MNQPTALIAEDEHLLAAALQDELALAWPALQVVATVGDGASAVQQALKLRPEVLFFDIRMPGMSGLEAAAELAELWEDDANGKPFPLLVFVTAYDQYAVEAFEAQAVDYLLKPVQATRLHKTVDKLQRTLAARTSNAGVADARLAQLRQLLQSGLDGAVATKPATPLIHVQASSGITIHMVAVSDIVYFEAADKYVRVLTANREYLIRTPLRELLPQLDGAQFMQIHRSVLVNRHCMESISRDEAGKLHMALRGRPEKLTISRLYAHEFKAM
ncbi:MAG: response regulator transcription factor [Rhodoferax sp.]|nr:response regulator transcription factor [Rhodoferax sp.]